MNKKLFFVAPFILLSLVLALWTGMLRLGWSFPLTEALVHHGALMVGSFLGSVIILERVVALKNKWLYLFPVISGLSGVLFLVGESKLAIICLLIASISLIAIYSIIIYRYKHYYFYVMLFGAFCWFIGNFYLYHGSLYAMSVNWWMAFVLFTVVGERLELSKFLPPKKVKMPLFWAAVLVFFSGLIIPHHGSGAIVMGTGLIAIGAWLFKYDIIRKSVKVKGIHRYTAVMLGFGYIWLLITGLIFISGNVTATLYDAVVHSFFIGFTFSMIFAHGPIIFPGVAGFPFKPFHNVLYWIGGVLEVSLIIRVIGDYQVNILLRKTGGMINGICILVFFVALVILIIFESRKWKKSIRKKSTIAG